MSKKNNPVITPLSLGDKIPVLGNKHVSTQLASILGTTKCDMQLATYDNGVKVLVKFPKVQKTDIGGAFRLTIPNENNHFTKDRLAVTVVGYKLADQLTFEGGLEAVNLNAYATLAVYKLKSRSAKSIDQLFTAINIMRVKFSRIADIQNEITDLSKKMHDKFKY